MKVIISILLLLIVNSQAKYLDSKTCQECHEDIHYEHMKSMHSKSSIFSDEVHRQMKNAVNKDKYSCALCHMPSTKNLSAMIRGQEQPNPNDVRQTDMPWARVGSYESNTNYEYYTVSLQHYTDVLSPGAYNITVVVLSERLGNFIRESSLWIQSFVA